MTSARPVASMLGGTGTTNRAGTRGRVTGGREVVAREVVGREAVELEVLLDDGAGRPELLLHAPQITSNATTAEEGLQTRSGHVETKAMAEAKSYPEAVDARLQAPGAQTDPAQPSLAGRVAELERVIATLASLQDERRAAARLDRSDPVALTAALHPGGMRSARLARRRTSNDGTLPLRFVLFDPSTSR